MNYSFSTIASHINVFSSGDTSIFTLKTSRASFCKLPWWMKVLSLKSNWWNADWLIVFVYNSYGFFMDSINMTI